MTTNATRTARTDTTDTTGRPDGRTGGPATPRPRRRRRGIWRTFTQPWFIRVHRWTSLVLGLLLVLECTSGVVLLYEGDIVRWMHPGWFAHTATAKPIGPDRALEIVRAQHPELRVTSAETNDGVYVVRNLDARSDAPAAFVDSGTGRINAVGTATPAFVGLMANAHDCAFACDGYSSTVAWMGTPIPFLPPNFTVSNALLGLLGLLLAFLALTGLVAWWPGIKRLARHFVVRSGRGGYVRDLDLHRIVGLAAIPFLLMWGISGTAFYFRGPSEVFFAVVPGTVHAPPALPAPGTGPQLSLREAEAAALKLHPTGKIRGIYEYAPDQKGGTYGFRIAEGLDWYRYASFSGSVYVTVDSHGGGTGDYPKSAGPPPERFWYNAMNGIHFGSVVPPAVRLIWTVFGLSPVLLGATGVTIWLTKRRSRTARKQRHRGSRATART